MDINRRNFLKGALVTGAAAAAAVALPACSPAAPSDASDAKSSSKGGETTGAKHTWEVAPEPIADIAETQDFDVVVVGAGLAGINAAEAAARNGAKTVVIERNTTFSVRGVDVGHIGSKYHKSNGFDLDPRVAARFLHQASHQTTNYDLIYVWASRSGEVFDYIEDLGSKNGVSMVPALSGTAKYGNWSTLSDRWRVYPDAVSFVRGGETYDMRDDGQPVNVTLGELVYNSAVDNGAEFVFEARAEQLVGDAASGITGVVATTKDGKHVQYNAKKGVILATGDIGGNQEMVDAFCPISNRSDSNCYAPAGFNNGDGLLMGMWAGAAMSKSEAAPMIHQFTLDTLEFNLTSFIMSWLAVNANGERYGAEMPFEPMLTNARMNTPGNVAWSIFDSDYETYIMQQQPERYDRFTDGLDAVMEKWLGNGKLIKADTLDDLAKQLDIPADTFKATVERYNSMAEAGEDVDFDVPAQWLAPVKTAPFYATKNVCSTLTIPFGLPGAHRRGRADSRPVRHRQRAGRLLRQGLPGALPRRQPRPLRDVRPAGRRSVRQGHDHRRARLRLSASDRPTKAGPLPLPPSSRCGRPPGRPRSFRDPQGSRRYRRLLSADRRQLQPQAQPALASALFQARVQRTAHLPDQRARDGQPQARPLARARRVGGVEGLEQPIDLAGERRVDIVRERHRHATADRLPHLHVEGRARVLAGVVHEVLHHPLQRALVAPHANRPVGHAQAHFQTALLEQPVAPRHRLAHQTARLHRLARQRRILVACL
mgnify:CR=1 FL=1